MSNKVGYVKLDLLFGGLTRVPMVFGVTYTYVMVNMMISMLYFVLRSDFKVVLIAGAIHGIAYSICLKEPLLIEMFINKQANFSKCKHKLIFNNKASYDFY
ncbi:MAG: type IV secretion system protein VirB3 [Candidatus Deianiraeaceae bacterium]